MATLSQRVKNWINNRGKMGHDGVVLIRDLVTQISGKDHDWNAAAEFLSATDNARDGTPNRALRLALRCYFGDTVKIRKDKEHATGYRFAFGSTGKWPQGSISPRNTWGVMVQAIEQKMSLDDKEFMNLLRKQFVEDKDEPTNEAVRAAYQKTGERLATKLFNDGIPPSVVIQALERKLAALKAQVKAEQANVVKDGKSNASDVIELDDVKQAVANA